MLHFLFSIFFFVFFFAVVVIDGVHRFLMVFLFLPIQLQCSVGCGQGYASREVKCMSGKEILVDQKCSKLVKPIKTRHCAGKTECKWKPDEWKSVTTRTDQSMSIYLYQFLSI